jgi:VanZ family protein
VLAPLALMAVIFWFSAQEAHEQLAWWEVAMRKVGHATGYALLTALWTRALSGFVRRPLLWACVTAFLYACSDEYHQTFVETRHGSPVDVLIDSVGIAVAAVAIHGFAIRSRL